MNGGTAVIPNLDSIEEFRVLTTNFDPEYGNYNGGIVTVVSKSGTNRFHGRAFEFFRNTNLNARGYFDRTHAAFNQNQFGGAIGGPIKRDKVFFFGDYQGTRTTQGISTGNISVPTIAQRAGTFDDLTGFVSGPYLASLLSQRLGRTITAGEPYTSVFPEGNIPQSVWSTPAKNLLQYIPSPNSAKASFPAPPSRKPSATTKAPYASTTTAGSANYLPTTSSTTTASITRTPARSPAQQSPASTPSSSAGRNSSRWEIQKLSAQICQRIPRRLSPQRQHHRPAKRRSRCQPRVTGLRRSCQRRHLRSGPAV